MKHPKDKKKTKSKATRSVAKNPRGSARGRWTGGKSSIGGGGTGPGSGGKGNMEF
jgi:hypothetical protein